ncbi:hypothetical protein LOTGIDRAFT_159690 [Lottia gigantea]|uniref:Uncharacterized protein n=1 Tax=Lottia gigantea TaxID=225164 RepID=V4AQ64_LOTGI|nr:hypothetical protein LOTGIDRAFT_159690 [Lottia gigantea]ESO96935.1 hypothetical protein LOTGIDRAFT_159690 [Lottia gigantea]
MQAQFHQAAVPYQMWPYVQMLQGNPQEFAMHPAFMNTTLPNYSPYFDSPQMKPKKGSSFTIDAILNSRTSPSTSDEEFSPSPKQFYKQRHSESFTPGRRHQRLLESAHPYFDSGLRSSTPTSSPESVKLPLNFTVYVFNLLNILAV